MISLNPAQGTASQPSHHNASSQTVRQPVTAKQLVLILLVFLVVLPIFGFIVVTILASKAVATVQQREKLVQLRSITTSNLRQVALAVAIYTADSDDVFPDRFKTSADLATTVTPYLRWTDESPMKTYNPNGGRLLPNEFLEGVSLSQVANPPDTVVVFESSRWPSGDKCYGFVDGKAKFSLSESKFTFVPKAGDGN